MRGATPSGSSTSRPEACCACPASATGRSRSGASNYPIDELARAFQVDLRREALGSFLLFGGASSEPVAAAFGCEEEAKAAFHQLRESLAGRSGWAELVVVNGRRGPRRLCWFERSTPGVEDQVRPSREPAVRTPRRARGLRVLRWFGARA